MFKSCFAHNDLCVCIEADDRNILSVSFTDHTVDHTGANDITDTAKTQIIEYLSRKRKYFDLPFISERKGTFKDNVFGIVSGIPYGEVMSYKQVAQELGDIKKARAVGQALNKNKLLLLIPCHRVIKSDGSTGGFAYGHDLKKRLIDLEAENK